eukprot:11784900-Alexandrium_andersonii.AAC.1
MRSRATCHRFQETWGLLSLRTPGTRTGAMPRLSTTVRHPWCRVSTGIWFPVTLSLGNFGGR